MTSLATKIGKQQLHRTSEQLHILRKYPKVLRTYNISFVIIIAICTYIYNISMIHIIIVTLFRVHVFWRSEETLLLYVEEYTVCVFLCLWSNLWQFSSECILSCIRHLFLRSCLEYFNYRSISIPMYQIISHRRQLSGRLDQYVVRLVVSSLCALVSQTWIQFPVKVKLWMSHSSTMK